MPLISLSLVLGARRDLQPLQVVPYPQGVTLLLEDSLEWPMEEM